MLSIKLNICERGMEKLDISVWENVKVNDDIPPSYTEITPDRIYSYAYSVGDWDPASIPVREESIGHAMLCANDILGAYRAQYTGLSGLHAKQEMEILNTPRLGKKVTINARHVDKYVKRGHQYRVMYSEAVDEDEVVYLRGRAHETFASSIGQAKGGFREAPKEGVPTIISGILVPCAYERIPMGAQVTPLCKSVTFEQMCVYTGMDRKTFHTDLEYSKSLGLPAPIAQGMMSACYISELMTRFFGYGWRRGGKMSVYFIKAVYAGDVLYVSGSVKEKIPEDDATRIILDVWCENQAGTKVTVGTASGLVR